MRVAPSGHVVGPGIKDVRSGALRVICGKLRAVKVHIDRLALARREELGLCKAHQLDGRLLDAVGAVVVRVGALRVDLHHVLAGNVTGVGDGHARRALLAIPAGREARPVKVGVREAIAKRVADLAVVVVVACVALAKNGVLVARLVVLVAYVDALLVAHVVVLGEVAGLVSVLVVAKVLRGRAGKRIGGKGVHRAAGRVHAPGEDSRERAHAVGPRGGNDQARLDVGELLEPAQLDRGGGAHDHQAVIKVVVDVLEDLQLGRVGLEVALLLVLLARGVVVHGARHVAALARNAAKHKDRRGALRGVEHACVLHDRERALVDGKVLPVAKAHGAGSHAVVLAGTVDVEVLQRGVHRKALSLKRAVQRVAG